MADEMRRSCCDTEFGEYHRPDCTNYVRPEVVSEPQQRVTFVIRDSTGEEHSWSRERSSSDDLELADVVSAIMKGGGVYVGNHFFFVASITHVRVRPS